MHYTIPTLYRDTALEIVRAFNEALYLRPRLDLTYLQVNGVRIELPSYDSGFAVLSQDDFEKVLAIFQDDPYGPILAAQRELGIPNELYYDRVLQEAVAAYFDPFPE